MILLDGKKIALDIQAQIKKKVDTISNRKPCLACIIVGQNPASHTYVKAKRKACLSVGIDSELIELPDSISQSELIKHIISLNRNHLIDAILVQLPLPSHIDEKMITSSIDPLKDVDGFHPLNVGKMLLGDETGFLPCTPLGIKTLLEKSNISIEGKHVVILGRSNIVGKPLAAMLIQNKPSCNATVTIGHSKSQNIEKLTLSADILISAIGKPHIIKEHMIQKGSCVIDVGINRIGPGRLVGDVDFENVSKKAGFITPVPGGIGPMTIAMLLQNTLKSYLNLNF